MDHRHHSGLKDDVEFSNHLKWAHYNSPNCCVGDLLPLNYLSVCERPFSLSVMLIAVAVLSREFFLSEPGLRSVREPGVLLGCGLLLRRVLCVISACEFRLILPRVFWEQHPSMFLVTQSFSSQLLGPAGGSVQLGFVWQELGLGYWRCGPHPRKLSTHRAAQSSSNNYSCVRWPQQENLLKCNSYQIVS